MEELTKRKGEEKLSLQTQKKQEKDGGSVKVSRVSRALRVTKYKQIGLICVSRDGIT